MSITILEAEFEDDCNKYLLMGNKTLLIDTGIGKNTNIVNILKEKLNGKNLDYILLTHSHLDHVGGIERILEHYDPIIYSSPYDSKWLGEANKEAISGKAFDWCISPVKTTPLLDRQVLDLGDHKLKIISSPGHTMGCICALDTVTKTLFSGDTFFVGYVGNTGFFSSSANDMIESLRKLYKEDFDALCPGHLKCLESGGKEELGWLINRFY